MESIHRHIKKIKQAGEGAVFWLREHMQNEEIFIVAVIILVGFGGFGLGRLSLASLTKSDVELYTPDSQKGIVDTGGAVAPQEISMQGNDRMLVASVTGSKYHLPWCSGALSIKEENKVWFASEEEARAAGYTPAANCKGF